MRGSLGRKNLLRLVLGVDLLHSARVPRALDRLSVACVSLLALASRLPASAQVADPVQAAYRAYVAARGRGDAPGAATAAAQALQASEARDGDGGSTAVLALNLALARLDAGRPADAVAPAQRARELAHKGAKGVDELQARLVLGEAQLTANPEADEQPVVAALSAADKRPDLDDAAYGAGIALTKAALKTRQRLNQVQAWRAVAVHADSSGDKTGLMRGHARTLEAVALITLQRFRDASGPINEAGRLLVGLAPEQADPAKITMGEYYFAEAVAVSAALRAARDDPALNQADAAIWKALDRPELPDRPPRCEGRMKYSQQLQYPKRPMKLGEVGAVVVRFRLDAAGKVLSAKAVSTVVAADFRKAVEDPGVHWTFEPDAKRSKPGCRLDTNDLLEAVVFMFD